VAVLMPPQLRLAMQGRTMYSVVGQEQMEPAAESSVPEPQRPVRHVRPSQNHEPVASVLRASAMASTTTGSVQDTPVVSNVPERVIMVHPIPSIAACQALQSVHCVVGVAPLVKTSEYGVMRQERTSHEPR